MLSSTSPHIGQCDQGATLKATEQPIETSTAVGKAFRADAVHGRSWGVKGQTPVVSRPGQRQSISAASAVNAKGGFWYCSYQGGLTAELFVRLLRKMMRHRTKPVHLVVDGLPAHKTKLVKDTRPRQKGG